MQHSNNHHMLVSEIKNKQIIYILLHSFFVWVICTQSHPTTTSTSTRKQIHDCHPLTLLSMTMFTSVGNWLHTLPSQNQTYYSYSVAWFLRVGISVQSNSTTISTSARKQIHDCHPITLLSMTMFTSVGNWLHTLPSQNQTYYSYSVAWFLRVGISVQSNSTTISTSARNQIHDCHPITLLSMTRFTSEGETFVHVTFSPNIG